MIKIYTARTNVTYEEQGSLVNVPTSWGMGGLALLPDAISCEVKEERNGIYELMMVYPSEGYTSRIISTDKILEVECPLRDSIGKNYFRIYRVERDLSGRMNVYARQVSMDLSYYIANGTHIEGVPGGITVFADSGGVHSYGWNLRYVANTNVPFIFGGDAEYDTSITGVGFQQNFSTCTSLRAFLGGEELGGYDKTALQRFGGEYEFDKWNVNLWEHRGKTRPVTITYGANMESLSAHDDLDGVYTGVCFFAQTTDGIEYKKYCSDIYNYQSYGFFPFPRIKTVDYSAEVMEYYPDGATTAQITAMLNSAASEYATAHYYDLPLRQIEVDAVEAELGEVYLCDSVKVIYRRNGLDLNAQMQITGYTWDVLMQRYTSITLGAIQTSLAKAIAEAGEDTGVLALQNVAASTQNAIQELQARYVAKAGDTMTGQLKLQSSNIDENTTPSANQWGTSHYQLLSKNGTRSAYWELGHLSDGKLGSEIGVIRNVNGSNVYNVITQWITSSGERIVGVSDSAAWRSALGVKWNTFIKIGEYTKPGVSTSAGTTRDYTFSVAQSGYTPVGVVGYRIASGGGTCTVSCYLSGTTVTMRVRNNGTSANTPDSVSITVLYCINA